MQLRVQLIAVLAPDDRCKGCARRMQVHKLEVDHVDGRTWQWHTLNALDRIRRMWHEHRRGIRLRALCRRCNAIDGAARRWAS